MRTEGNQIKKLKANLLASYLWYGVTFRDGLVSEIEKSIVLSGDVNEKWCWFRNS